ncbi:PH domain-containing protein [Alkalihalophilus marmarensis]|uniref:PH domain-containing protein n=1 Tax=Alkalihalophilus marmarensis TaxID=521377 RepID=UPI002DBD9B7A|nr:PH domain-containing protein [Alkalihalophilus marmarensis]MEC2073253.1 PH domain-containing protein [Alkalihalophilus marmarensis]
MLFNSNRDFTMNSIFTAILLFMFSFLYYMIRFVEFTPIIFMAFIVYLVGMVLGIHLIFRIRYWLHDEHLTSQMGSFFTTWHYEEMAAIDYSKGLTKKDCDNYLGSTAALKIQFKSDKKKSIRISPEREEEFIQELFKRAPHLSYCSIEEYRAMQMRIEEVAQHEVITVPHLGDAVKAQKVGSSSSTWLKL